MSGGWLLVRTNVTNHWINHNKENPWSKHQIYEQLAKQNFLQASTWYQTISDAWIIRVIASPLNHFFSFFLLPPWSSKFNWCSDQSVTTHYNSSIHFFSAEVFNNLYFIQKTNVKLTRPKVSRCSEGSLFLVFSQSFLSLFSVFSQSFLSLFSVFF